MLSTRIRPAGGNRPPRPARIVAVEILLALPLILAQNATAQTTVTSLEDAGPGTLREALAGAAANDQLILDPGTAGDIELESVLDVTTTVTIDNSATASDNLVGIEAPGSANTFDVDDAVRLTLRDVNLLEGGNSSAAINLEGPTSVLIFDLSDVLDDMEVSTIGTGRVEKTGDGELIFDPSFVNNTFSGGLTIRNGSVRGNSGNLADGDITLAPDSDASQSRVIFDVESGDSEALAAGRRIIYAGGAVLTPVFEKAGEGALNLTASAGIDTGVGIEISGGTLIAQPALLDNSARSNTVSIGSSGTLLLQTPGADDSYVGAISGAGTLEIDFGADTFTLQSDLTGSTVSSSDGFLGLARVSSGTLFLSPATPTPEAHAFDVSLPTATSIFQIDEGVTFAGGISGSGQLITGAVAGTGVVTLSGTASHTGGTVMLGGTLIGNTNNLQGSITIASGSTLQYAQDFDGSFSGGWTGGPGTILKSGTGLLTLATSQSVDADFNVDAGGLVIGSGVDLDLMGGTLQIGNTAGSAASLSAVFDPTGTQAQNTVDIMGDLTLNDGATLIVDINDRVVSGLGTPISTLFRVSGTTLLGNNADPAQANLTVRLAPGIYAPGSNVYTVLSTTTLDPASENLNVSQDYLFYTLSGAFSGTDYQVTILPNPSASYESQAQTDNQRAVGRSLDVLRSTPSSDPATNALIASLNVQQSSTVSSDLDTLGGDDLAAHTSARLAIAARTWRSLSDRMVLNRGRSIGHGNVRDRRQRDYRRQLRRNALGDARPFVDAPPRADGQMLWTAWGQVGGALGELDGGGGSQSVDYDFFGPLLGADRAMNETIRLGFATGYTRSRYNTDLDLTRGDADTLEAVAYATFGGERLQGLFAARYAHSWMRSDRYFQISTISDRPDSDFEGDEIGTYLEAGWSFGRRSTLEITPYASTAYSRIDSDDFEESGNNLLRLNGEVDVVHSASTSLGLRLALDREIDDGFFFRPRMRVAWGREWADTDRKVTSQFEAGGTPFRVEGAPFPDDVAEVTLGWDVAYEQNANLFISYDGRFAPDLVENALSLGLRVNW